MDKLKGIISARNKKTSSVNSDDTRLAQIDLRDAPAVSRYVQAIADSKAIEENPQKLRDIIESIEPTYLQEPASFQKSASSYELDKFLEIPSLSAIDDRRAELICQHRAVSKKLGESILQNESSYKTELKRVIELTIDVEQAARIAQAARGSLRSAQSGFTNRSLKLLADCARRRRALRVLRSLKVLRTLKDTEIHLKEMLIEGGDFLSAIFISIEFTNALRQYGSLGAARDLHNRLQDSLLMIDDALNRAVKRCCIEFVPSDYHKIKRGFVLIGKQHLFVEQIQSAFSNLLHTHATQVLHSHFVSAPGTDSKDSSNSRSGSVSVPPSASAHEALATLVDFCAYFFKLFVNYRAMLFVESQLIEGSFKFDTEMHDTEADNATLQRLSSGRYRLWAECEARVRNLLSQIDFQSFKIDEFVRLLRIIQLLCAIGDEFLGPLTHSASEKVSDEAALSASNSTQLTPAASNQSLVEILQRVTSVYFRAFHRSSLEQLRLFLEHEVWELCPVTRADTAALERIWQQNASPISTTNGLDVDSNVEEVKTNVESASNRFDSEFESSTAERSELAADEVVKKTISRLKSPFDAALLGRSNEDEMDEDENPGKAQSTKDEAATDKSADEDEKNRTGSVSSQSMSLPSGGGIITSATSLEVLRLLSKYLEVARLLRPIAYEVSFALAQLFEYYLYSVYSFFSTRLSNTSDFVMDDEENNSQRAKLLSTLHRIKKWIGEVANLPPAQNAMHAPDQRPFGVPVSIFASEMQSSETLCGFTKRVVATESLLFLAGQFERTVPYLSAVIPAAKRPFLAHFQSHTLGVVTELRPFVFVDVAHGALAYNRVLALCRANANRWDAREIATQHSDYIDVLLGEFELLRIRMQDAKRALAEANAAKVPPVVKCFIFARALRYAAAMLVDCFAVQNGRCTNEGRALMQLDFQQFVVQVEKILPKRLIARPGSTTNSSANGMLYSNTLKQCREYVETYIKAFYFNEDQVENWLKEQHTYRADQLTALVRSMQHLSKRTRQRLQVLIEEQAALASAAAAQNSAAESNNNANANNNSQLQTAADFHRESPPTNEALNSNAPSTPGVAKPLPQAQPQGNVVSAAAGVLTPGDRTRQPAASASVNHSSSPLTLGSNSTRKLANIFHKSNG